MYFDLSENDLMKIWMCEWLIGQVSTDALWLHIVPSDYTFRLPKLHLCIWGVNRSGHSSCTCSTAYTITRQWVQWNILLFICWCSLMLWYCFADVMVLKVILVVAIYFCFFSCFSVFCQHLHSVCSTEMMKIKLIEHRCRWVIKIKLDV